MAYKDHMIFKHICLHETGNVFMSLRILSSYSIPPHSPRYGNYVVFIYKNTKITKVKRKQGSRTASTKTIITVPKERIQSFIKDAHVG